MPRRSARLSEKREKCKDKGHDYTYDELLEIHAPKTKGCRKKCNSRQIRSKTGRCYTPRKMRKTPARKNTKKKNTKKKNTSLQLKISKLEKEIKSLKKKPKSKRKTTKKGKKCPNGYRKVKGMPGFCALK